MKQLPINQIIGTEQIKGVMLQISMYQWGLHNVLTELVELCVLDCVPPSYESERCA